MLANRSESRLLRPFHEPFLPTPWRACPRERRPALDVSVCVTLRSRCCSAARAPNSLQVWARARPAAFFFVSRGRLPFSRPFVRNLLTCFLRTAQFTNARLVDSLLRAVSRACLAVITAPGVQSMASMTCFWLCNCFRRKQPIKALLSRFVSATRWSLVLRFGPRL